MAVDPSSSWSRATAGGSAGGRGRLGSSSGRTRDAAGSSTAPELPPRRLNSSGLLQPVTS